MSRKSQGNINSRPYGTLNDSQDDFNWSERREGRNRPGTKMWTPVTPVGLNITLTESSTRTLSGRPLGWIRVHRTEDRVAGEEEEEHRGGSQGGEISPVNL